MAVYKAVQGNGFSTCQMGGLLFKALVFKLHMRASLRTELLVVNISGTFSEAENMHGITFISSGPVQSWLSSLSRY